MSDEPQNLVLYRLEVMHRQNNRILEGIDRLIDDMLSLKIRMTAVEEAVVGINWRLDRHEERLDRIERRLGLIEH